MKFHYLVIVGTLIVGLLGVGSGFANGDAVVYLHQALDLDFGQRSTHLGYIAMAAPIGLLLGERTALALDIVTVVMSAVSVAMMTSVASRLGREPAVSALVMAATLLPLTSFAEVDTVWFAALVASLLTESRKMRLVLVMFAISVSPVALLALPWAISLRTALSTPGKSSQHKVDFVVGALLAVAILCLVSGGEWLTGDRGLMSGGSVRLAATIKAWSHAILLPGILVAATVGILSKPRYLLLLLSTTPLLLAPPDVPGWIPTASVLALMAADRKRLAIMALLIAQFVLQVSEWERCRARVVQETTIAATVAAQLGLNDGLVAPWSWGVRVSYLRTGHPYAEWWRTPTDPVRDQVSWCNRQFDRVAVLPPGRDVESSEEWTTGVGGVKWAPWHQSLSEGLPGCLEQEAVR